MLRFLLILLFLFSAGTLSANSRDMICNSALGSQEFVTVSAQLSNSFKANSAILRERFSRSGLGYIHLTNVNWEPKAGVELYKQFPRGTNVHIDTAWFEVKKQKIVYNKVPILFAYGEKAQWDDFEFSWNAIHAIEQLAWVIRDQLNESLPDEEIEIYRIGFLHHHHDSRDLLNTDAKFYQPHLDKNDGDLYQGGCYLRAVMTLFGPGTTYWPQFPEIAKQSKAGDVLIIEGEDRQQKLKIHRDLLWHQIPNMTGTHQGRLAIRIDFKVCGSFPRNGKSN